MEFWTPATLLVERKHWNFWGKGLYSLFEEFIYKILLSSINSSLFHFSWDKFKFDLRGSFIDDLEDRGVCESFALRYLKKWLGNISFSVWKHLKWVFYYSYWALTFCRFIRLETMVFACLQGYENLCPWCLEHLLWYFAKRHLYFML